MEKFWMVIKGDAGGHSTCQFRHVNPRVAKEEARRLAAKENCPFYILEAVYRVAPVDRPIGITRL